MADQLPDILLDFQLETTKGGSSRRRVAHIVHDPDLPPSAAPRLEIWESAKRAIGRGGQGDVLLQTCTSDGPRCDAARVIKVIRCFDDEGRRRYVRELETMVRFSHDKYSKFFVKMLGWYFTRGKGDLCIAMEYLPNRDLYSLLQDRPPLGESDAKQVIGQVLQGLNIMHKAGFAHRDIKPQNVLIQQLPSSDGPSTWWVKLADFGISKSLEATYSVVAIGTYDYMAPELFHRSDSASKLDVRPADIWAVGVMTFYILTKNKGFRDWRSSSLEFVQRTEAGTAPARFGSDGSVVDFDAVLFVLKATTEHLEGRLRWEDAGQHFWLGLHGSTPGLAVEENDDDVSSVCSWSSSSSLDDCDDDEERGLTTVVTETETATKPSEPAESLKPAEPAEPTDSANCIPRPEATAKHQTSLVPESTRQQGDEALAKNTGELALFRAAQRGDTHMINYLASQGVNVSCHVTDLLTPLHAVSRWSINLDAARALLSWGADIEARDYLGYTPLRWAATQGRVEMIKLLVGRGADINTPDNYGFTPLYDATREGHEETARLLEQLGAVEFSVNYDQERSQWRWA